MAKKSLCPKPGHAGAPCGRPKWAPKHSCFWHYMLTQPIEVQVHAALWRLDRVAEPYRRSRVPETEWPAGERFCSGCQTFVPLFYARGSRCKPCASRASHAAHIEKTYGLTGEDYQSLLRAQGGRCAICRCAPQTRRLVVDHDHRSGEVRGLLCTRCNHDLLGAAHDSLEILRAAVAYLEHPPYGQQKAPAGFSSAGAFHTWKEMQATV